MLWLSFPSDSCQYFLVQERAEWGWLAPGEVPRCMRSRASPRWRGGSRLARRAGEFLRPGPRAELTLFNIGIIGIKVNELIGPHRAERDSRAARRGNAPHYFRLGLRGGDGERAGGARRRAGAERGFGGVSYAHVGAGSSLGAIVELLAFKR